MRIEDIIADYEKILEIVSSRLKELKSGQFENEFNQKKQEILDKVQKIRETVNVQLEQMGRKNG